MTKEPIAHVRDGSLPFRVVPFFGDVSLGPRHLPHEGPRALVVSDPPDGCEPACPDAAQKLWLARAEQCPGPCLDGILTVAQLIKRPDM
jgi:hypothetical protein